MTGGGALAGLRVLEVGSAAAYAGKLFRDHGAEVLLIEPPEGSDLRFRPPFIENANAPERSLSFMYLAAGKKSIVIDLEDAAERNRFRELVANADIVLDDRLRNWWDERDLGYESLRGLNSRLVWCSVTPFGQTGPYADRASCELVAMAAGGMTWLTGYADTPVTCRGGIAERSAALYAAVASLAVALGPDCARGRYIDVSVQEVVVLGTETGPQFHDLQGILRRRNPDFQKQAGIGVYPCLDGWVMVYAAEAGVGTGWTRLIQWMVSEGIDEARPMLSEEWATNEHKQSPAARKQFAEAFARFASLRPKQEMFVEGQRRRIAIAPVNGPEEVLNDPHLQETDFFRKIDLPDGRQIRVPGAAFRMSRTPAQAGRSAPVLNGTGQ